MERMGKGLLWNGAPVAVPSATPTPTATPTPAPVVFIPVPLALPLPIGDLPSPTPDPLPTPAWPQVSSPTTGWADSEVIGPQVFRFEYYYLLTDGSFSDVPWLSPDTSVRGMQGVSAIIVDIAVIDPKSKVLLSNSQISQVSSQLIDWGNTTCVGCPTQSQWQGTPGLLLGQWQSSLNGITNLPSSAISGIRVYERFFYLSPPVL